MGKSERRSSTHLLWWVLCFLLVKKVLNTKRKESAQRREEFVLVGCFYLEKGVQTIIRCFVLERKRKASFSFNHMQNAKRNKQSERLDLWLRMQGSLYLC